MKRRKPSTRAWGEVSPEEVEAADRFFEALTGADRPSRARSGSGLRGEAIEYCDVFFRELTGRPASRSARPAPRRGSQPREESFELDVLAPGLGEHAHDPHESFDPENTTPRRITEDATARWLQEALNRVASAGLTVDGKVGSNTRAAVRDYQRRHQLPGHGRVLATTLHRLAYTVHSVPAGVYGSTPPRSQGRQPDMSSPCGGRPTVLDRFPFGSASPTAAHRAALAQLAQSIVASQSRRDAVHLVCFTGHTDAVGAVASNEQLGQRRAEAVQDELATQIDRLSPGLSARLGLWSTSDGETRPVAPNRSDADRARNRRVEVRLGRRWQSPSGSSGVSVTTVGRVGTSAESIEPESNGSPSFQVKVGKTLRLRATGRPTPVGNPGYAWTSSNPAVATVTLVGSSQTHPNMADVRGVGAGSTTVSVTYRSSSGSTATTTVAITVPPPVTRYGCHALKRGDMDQDPADSNRPRWGGVAGAAAHVCTPPPSPVPTNPTHVRQLQEDLRALGFLIVGTPSGTFDRNTEWAVREFQIYAKMATVARVKPSAAATLQRDAHLVAADNGHDTASNLSAYVNSLEAVTNNTVRYTGPVSGVVNADTRAAIDHWVSNRWRCPVIVEAWNMSSGARSTPAETNLWAHDSHASSTPRMFVRDFTGYYTMPTGRSASDMHVLGDFQTYLTWSGPRSAPPRHTWSPEGEILPASLVGSAAPTGNTLSTYRVVRAVSEVECIGFYDSVNSYDNAFISVGPCHWTLGIVSSTGAFSEGELCGYLAYLRHIDNAAFQQGFEFFGMRVDENWVSAAGPADGADMFSSSQRKYTGWVALQQQSGGFTRLAQTEADGNYFKTWHWFYRFVMAGRTIAGYRQRMWDMARVRIRDILAVPWGAGVANVGTGAAARPATIGDVFTSERAVAMLVRWHIRFPGRVISGGGPATRLRNALTNAQTAGSSLTWTGDPSGWTDAHETHLIAGILAAASSGVQASLTRVRDWPSWLTGSNPRGYTLAAPVAAALDDDRDSFDFDTAGLPPAPP